MPPSMHRVAGPASGQAEDTPPPNTDAGRAAAMRPPRAEPRRRHARDAATE
ncbi:hypothetical protein [Nocardia sp. NPDC005998]|uniref:hypothetical protein n=1 Tax=Nocardia sp. NPDC005998 TaxID=3156894 RepID=UPI0033B6EB05